MFVSLLIFCFVLHILSLSLNSKIRSYFVFHYRLYLPVTAVGKCKCSETKCNKNVYEQGCCQLSEIRSCAIRVIGHKGIHKFTKLMSFKIMANVNLKQRAQFSKKNEYKVNILPQGTHKMNHLLHISNIILKYKERTSRVQI